MPTPIKQTLDTYRGERPLTLQYALYDAVKARDVPKILAVADAIVVGELLIASPPPPPGEKIPVLKRHTYGGKCNGCGEYAEAGELTIWIRRIGLWHPRAKCWKAYAERWGLKLFYDEPSLVLVKQNKPSALEEAAQTPVVEPRVEPRVEPPAPLPTPARRLNRRTAIRFLRSVNADVTILLGNVEVARILALPETRAFLTEHAVGEGTIRGAYYEYRRREREELGLTVRRLTRASRPKVAPTPPVDPPAPADPLFPVDPLPSVARPWWKIW